MADAERSIERLVEVVRSIVRTSNALFGYVFELAPGHKTFLRGLPVPGSISDVEILRGYYKTTGNRALELVAQALDQAILVTTPKKANPSDCSWFATIVTQGLDVSACVAIIYPFYDQDEAVRTLRLVEMVLAKERNGA